MARKRLSKSSLLWFIRSRSYVSVADLRRRFGLIGGDDVSAISGPSGRAYVGLPIAQACILQELWRDGKVGFELAADIRAPLVNGVFGLFGGSYQFQQRSFQDREESPEEEGQAVAS